MNTRTIAIAALVALVLLAGCISGTASSDSNEEPSAQVEDSSIVESENFKLHRIVDEEAGVICYVRAYSGGLSCLPLNETELR